MAKVSVKIGLTLALDGRVDGASKFEFIRPEIEIADIVVDGTVSVTDQLELARKAIKPVWNMVDAAVEKMCEESFKE